MSEITPQDAFSVANGLSAFGKISEQKVFQTNAQILPLPIPAYDGQSEQTFNRGLSLYHARPVAGTRSVSIPLTRLSLFTMENARFVLYPGLDGMIIDSKTIRLLNPPASASMICTSTTAVCPTCRSTKNRKRFFWGSTLHGGTITTGCCMGSPKPRLPAPCCPHTPDWLCQICPQQALPTTRLLHLKHLKHPSVFLDFRIVFFGHRRGFTGPKNCIFSGMHRQCLSFT